MDYILRKLAYYGKLQCIRISWILTNSTKIFQVISSSMLWISWRYLTHDIYDLVVNAIKVEKTSFPNYSDLVVNTIWVEKHLFQTTHLTYMLS